MPEVLRATGHALARTFHAGVPISEFDMRNLAGPTYEAFCDWQPWPAADGRDDATLPRLHSRGAL